MPLGASIPLYTIYGMYIFVVYYIIFNCVSVYLFILGLFTDCSRTMPRKYKRKEGLQVRVCSWTIEQLQSAFEEIDKKTIGINEISRQFGIPSRTLRRRYAARNTAKLTLGMY